MLAIPEISTQLPLRNLDSRLRQVGDLGGSSVRLSLEVSRADGI